MTKTFQLQKSFDIGGLTTSDNIAYSSCSLYLIVGDNYISYTVLDNNQRKFFVLKSYFFENDNCEKDCRKLALESLINDEGLNPGQFGRVVLAVENDTYSLVPAPLYDPLLNQEYLKSLRLDQPEQLFFKDEIKQPDVINVYSIDTCFYKYIKEQLPNAIIRHVVSHTIASLQQDNLSASGYSLSLLIRQNHFYIALLLDGELKFEHAYYYEAALDIVYHVLNCFKQFQLELDVVTVRLGGETSTDSRIFVELDKYIPRLSWLQRPEYFNYISAFDEYPENYFYILFAMGLCE